MYLSGYEVFTRNGLSLLTPKRFENIVNPRDILSTLDVNIINRWIQNNMNILDFFGIFNNFGYQAIQRESYKVKDKIERLEIIFVERRYFWFPQRHIFYIDVEGRLKATCGNIFSINGSVIEQIYNEQVRRYGYPISTKYITNGNLWNNSRVDNYKKNKLKSLTIYPATFTNDDLIKHKSTIKTNKDNKRLVKELSFSAKGKKRLAEVEGIRLFPYYDSTGKQATLWEKKKGITIGFGYLIKDEKEFELYKNGITQEQAIEMFEKELPKYEKIVKDNIKVPLTQNQYDALVMRAYNCGNGGFSGKYSNTNGSLNMLEYINSGRSIYTDEFDRYYQKLSTSGVYMKGVEIRRIKELDVFKHNDYTEHSRADYEKRIIYGKYKAKTNKK